MQIEHYNPYHYYMYINICFFINKGIINNTIYYYYTEVSRFLAFLKCYPELATNLKLGKNKWLDLIYLATESIKVTMPWDSKVYIANDSICYT